MFKNATKWVLVLLGLILGVFAVYRNSTQECCEHRHAEKEKENIDNSNPQSGKTLEPEVLYPHTEEGLRLEIRDRNDNGAYRITAILYRARWNASKDPIRYGRKWIEMSDRYKPVLNIAKFHAIMHRADYDQARGYHEILRRF